MKQSQCKSNEKGLLLETVVEAELYHAPVGECGADLPELGRIDVVVPNKKRRVIENVTRLHSKLDCVALGDVGQLLNPCVHIEDPGSGEIATLQSADSPGPGIEEHLSGKRRSAIRRNRAAIGANDGFVHKVRSVTRHAESDHLI